MNVLFYPFRPVILQNGESPKTGEQLTALQTNRSLPQACFGFFFRISELTRATTSPTGSTSA